MRILGILNYINYFVCGSVRIHKRVVDLGVYITRHFIDLDYLSIIGSAECQTTLCLWVDRPSATIVGCDWRIDRNGISPIAGDSFVWRTILLPVCCSSFSARRINKHRYIYWLARPHPHCRRYKSLLRLIGVSDGSPSHKDPVHIPFWDIRSQCS